jgi:hypothetical protein
VVAAFRGADRFSVRLTGNPGKLSEVSIIETGYPTGKLWLEPALAVPVARWYRQNSGRIGQSLLDWIALESG